MRATSVYLLLWTLGCAAGLVAALMVLYRRRVLTHATALALALAWLFLFIGSKWHSRLEHLPWIEALLVSPTELFAPGRRLPLGLLTSGVAAALCCLALRLPWREVGDALAVFWSVLIPVGRIGCMAYGCCLGTVCGAWLAPLGWRYGPGSEAFHLQLAAGLIAPTRALSLPVHPLPAYFALASLGTLAVLLWLLRHGAAPGTLLLAFCILRPATKLALEPLRAEPAAPGLMIGIPAATLAVALAAGVYLVLCRAGVVRRRRRLASAMLLPLVVVATSPPVVRADERPWTDSLTRYAQDPLRHRRLLRRLEREGRDDHPPVVLLALADARLRSGSFAEAGRLFERVIAAAPRDPLVTWAVLGRTWASVLGDTPATPSEHGPVAAVVHGLAGAGDDQSLARVVDDARASPALRAAAQLAMGYARYWAHDDAGAIAAFDAAVEAADGHLVDDASYGAARTRLRAGDVGGALPILHDLATWRVNGRPGAATAGLVALDREALLRAGFSRYRRAGIRTPEQQLLLMLDGDGAALARAALRDLGERAPEPRHRASRARAAAPAPTRVVRPPTQEHARLGSRFDVASAWLRRVLLGAAILAALLIAHTWWWERRIPPGGNHGPRKG